jgi:steroid delta-isomerase-like uncharacterized protein
MSGETAEVTTNDLQAFADAWNRHDLEALMSFMTEDCVFEASAGPELCGTRSEGRDAVRAAFADVWATFPNAHWANARHFVYGDRGVSEWTFTGTRRDGTHVEVHGCDLFTFRDGKIAVKNSYRKNRPLPMKMTSLIPMLPVRHMPASVEFYQKLGFNVEQRNDGWGWAMLRFDECRLMVDQSINRDRDAPRQSVLYLYPNDIVAYHGQVRANGLAIPDLETTFYGMTEFRLDDPDGNRLWIGLNPKRS